MRGATPSGPCATTKTRYFNPRSSCEERPTRITSASTSSRHFNPRSSCEERPRRSMSRISWQQFQSTLLMRGATTTNLRPVSKPYFNPRSSCEERPSYWFTSYIVFYISIHAPHARSDSCCKVSSQWSHFISIHAPHARSDRPRREASHPRYPHFNPRSSCEERP